ncbi:aldehyde dehydrogenase family protein [Azospirillum sp. HJ39]|uniref:aldehyde dehydrogenase family protein n=1 Tax=Azospirillum sp. HJ39 TaxID=3159496 RepID=UPI003556F3DB
MRPLGSKALHRPGRRIEQRRAVGPSYLFPDLPTSANGFRFVDLSELVRSRDVPARGGLAARRIRSGQVHINHPARDPHARSGGYKQSGNGREYGLGKLPIEEGWG